MFCCISLSKSCLYFCFVQCFLHPRSAGMLKLGQRVGAFATRQYGAPFVSEVRESGPWRTSVTGRWDGLLKQTARIPHADCCKSQPERAVGSAVDGQPWRAAGADFWNKRYGFLAPIVAEVRQSGPWTAVRDGPPGGTFETNGTDSWRRLLQKSVRVGRGSRPWTDGRDGPPERTFETNGTDSWRRLLQKFVRAGRGRPVVTGRREGLLKQTARIPGADCCRSPSERAVGAGRGRTAVTGRRNGLLKQTARIPGADCCRSSSERAVAAGRGRPVVTGGWDVLLKQTARISHADCCKSEWAVIRKGIPQGSILGPLLFNVFVNDMFHFMEKCDLYNYADDNSLSVASYHMHDVLSYLSRDCKNSVKWFRDNGMQANPSKFQFMIISHSGFHASNATLQIDDNIILKPEPQVKVLGVMLDSKLDFNHHVSTLCTKAARQLNALARISRFFSTSSRMIIYNSFINSNFNYCPIDLSFRIYSKFVANISRIFLCFVYIYIYICTVYIVAFLWKKEWWQNRKNSRASS